MSEAREIALRHLHDAEQRREQAEARGSPTDAEILDWLQKHCRMDWPFGNEIQVTARCLSLHVFKDRPSLREAVTAAIKSEND